MTKYEALFLQDLINRASMNKTKKKIIQEENDDNQLEDREYFLCTVKYLTRPPMSWDKKTQLALIKSLQTKGFIKVTRKGSLLGKRFIWIDILKIETALDNSEKTTPTNTETSRRPQTGSSQMTPNRVIQTTPNRVAKKVHSTSTNVEEERTHCPCDPKVAADGVNLEQLFETKDNKSKFIDECVERLHNKVVEKNLVHRKKLNLKLWKTNFTKLVQEEGVAKVKEVLDWFLTVIGNEFIPEAYSGETFYKKFDKLVIAMNKSKVAIETELPISPEGKEILAKLTNKTNFPNNKELQQAIEKSILTFSEFRDRFYRLKKVTPEKIKVDERRSRSNTLHWVIQEVEGTWRLTATSFLSMWFEKVYKRLSGWEDAGWDLSKEVFNIDHKRFLNMGKNLMEELGSNVSAWQDFINSIKSI